MKSYKLQSSVTVEAPHCEVFQSVFSYDLLEVFDGFSFLPRFVHPAFDRNSDGEGSQRLIYFEGMFTVRQQLLSVVPGSTFLVRLTDFKLLRLYWLRSLDYQFCFFVLSPGHTLMRCEYTFLVRTPLWDFLFRRYVQKVLQDRINAFLVSMSKKLSYCSDFQQAEGINFLKEKESY